MRVQQIHQIVAGTIAEAKPDEFWRMSIKNTAFVKIRIFRDDDKVIGAGKFPNVFVGETFHSAIADVDASGEFRREEVRQFRREILVKQQLHAA